MIDTGSNGYFWIDNYWQYRSSDGIVGTSHDGTEVDGFRVMIPNDTTINIICRELTQAAVVPVHIRLHNRSIVLT